MLKRSVHQQICLLRPTPLAAYGAQGLDSLYLLRHRNRPQPVYRFMNAFQTPIPFYN